MIKGVNQYFFLFQICEVGGLVIIYKRIIKGRNCGPQSLPSSKDKTRDKVDTLLLHLKNYPPYLILL